MRITKLITVCATLFLLLQNYNGFSTSIETEGLSALVVDFSEWKSEKVDVKIMDQYGKILLDEEVSTVEKRKYNLKKLTDGEYTIEVRDALKIKQTDFTLKNGKVIKVNAPSIEYMPVVHVNADAIDVNVLALGKSTSISIASDGDMVYSRTIKGEQAISSRLDIATLPSGDYQLYVSKGNITKAVNFKR